MEQLAQAEGNTMTSASKCRRWCFTLNNWNEDERVDLVKSLEHYIIGKEIGENGTPHLQGYCEFKNPRNLSALKKINTRIHWERAKGNRSENIIYCTKDNNYEGNFRIHRPLEVITELKPWQQEIENLILTIPDHRSIYWFWEPEGNIGKTSFIKYLLNKYEWITFSRAQKSADIVTCASEDFDCYVFDFARSAEGFAPWNALEQLKDGLISDSKLKKKTVNILINCPHIIIFANWPPANPPLSEDRLIVKEIIGG